MFSEGHVLGLPRKPTEQEIQHVFQSYLFPNLTIMDLLKGRFTGVSYFEAFHTTSVHVRSLSLWRENSKEIWCFYLISQNKPIAFFFKVPCHVGGEDSFNRFEI